MTALLLLALASTTTKLPSPVQEEVPKPSALLGKMLARYAGARSLSGKVLFRQAASAQGQRAEMTVRTEFAVERPGRLRIAQTSSKRPQQPFVVTSDGKTFTYEAPRVTLVAQEPDHRMEQPVVDPSGKSPIGRILAMSRITLPDAGSPYLALASAWEADLQNLRAQWVSLEDGGAAEFAGKACRIVKGRWRQGAVDGATGKAQLPTGVFGIWLTSEGELLKYSTEETLEVADEKKQSLARVTVLSEWTGEIQIDPVIPDGTFTVLR